MIKLALARVNYSQLYSVYDDGKTFKQRDILTPYHLLFLASYMEQYSVDVRIFDAEVDLMTQEKLAISILEWDPDFVGITTTTPDINLDFQVCQLLKDAKPSIVTVFGGSHSSAIPHDVALNKYVDHVVVGDGESALLDIVHGRYHDTDDKIIYSKVQDVKTLPMPAHHLIDYEKYKFSDPHHGRVRTASIMSARGCPFECNFCFHNRNVRYREVDDFIAEIGYLYAVKGVKYFYVYDDTFFIRKSRISEIANRIKDLQISDAYFQCLTRGNTIYPDLLEELRAINFVRVSMGIESGSDQTLLNAHKGVSKSDYINACEILHSTGMETRGSFIIGHPYENQDSVFETIEFSKELKLYHANFNIMTPYPGTEIYDKAKAGDGIYFREPHYAHEWDLYRRWGHSVVKTDELSGEQLESLQKKCQVEFYTQDKLYNYYFFLFNEGNKSRYFYRPLNFAWNAKFNENIPFWNDLEQGEVINPT